MYPALLVPLTVLAGVVALGVGYVALRQPVARRLALRQLARRRSEAVLAVIGATLGTAIVIGALTVGDTLNFSVRQVAYRTLGPIDERVLSGDVHTAAVVADRLAPLRRSPDVDGVLSATFASAAAATGQGRVVSAAEPRVTAWDIDFAAAARFGGHGASGLDGAPPRPGEVVLNAALASTVHARTGQDVTLFLFGVPQTFRVTRVVPDRGLAGTGFGATVNRNAYLPPGVLAATVAGTGGAASGVTFVSNRGGVESGVGRTDRVLARMRTLLGPYGHTSLISSPKRDVLRSAQQTGDSLGVLFLMIGSFSIIAAALLLANIFVMLAEDRKSQLGMLRAIGLKRSWLVGGFTLEGACYSVAGVLAGIGAGVGIGWAVAQVAGQIFRSFSVNGDGLDITFAVTSTSIVNGALIGLVICMGTIVVASLRISRVNIIAAIRDLPAASVLHRRRTVVLSTVAAVLLTPAAVAAVASDQAEGSYLLPAAAAALFGPLLARHFGNRATVTAIGSGVTAWSLLLPVVRPHLFDSASTAVYVVQGTIVALAAVVVVSANQEVVFAPLRHLFGGSSEVGLAVRLATAYPLARRFRTGATLMMYTLITLVLVLLVEIAGVINASVDRSIADATAGYALRLDIGASTAGGAVAGLDADRARFGIAATTPLLEATASASDPGHRDSQPLRAVAVGVAPGGTAAMAFSSRLKGLHDDRSVWRLLDRDTRYAVLDPFFGATGGPNGVYYRPGDSFTLTDPRTGRQATRIIAGILRSAFAFYPAAGSGSGAPPVIAGRASVQQLFGASARVDAALVALRPGSDPQAVSERLQATFLSDSLVATPLAASVRRLVAANVAFFRLMQAFLALGLLVSISGLGVVMVRAVRERRRTVGVLRALGFQARTVDRSLLQESLLVAAEGVLLGSVLGVVTTWLMYQKSAAFGDIDVPFPVEWVLITSMVAVTLLASLAATAVPARNAARIRPAVAVRVAD